MQRPKCTDWGRRGDGTAALADRWLSWRPVDARRNPAGGSAARSSTGMHARSRRQSVVWNTHWRQVDEQIGSPLGARGPHPARSRPRADDGSVGSLLPAWFRSLRSGLHETWSISLAGTGSTRAAIVLIGRPPAGPSETASRCERAKPPHMKDAAPEWLRHVLQVGTQGKLVWIFSR